MKLLRLAVTAVMFAAATSHSPAADLSKVDRSLQKEPAYRGEPKYCLLVFGPEAKTRVWLVLDGDVLYVDRNGNGDLTEPGKRVNKKAEGKYGLTFDAGTVTDGTLTHTGLQVGVHDLAQWADDVRDWPEYQKVLRDNPKAKIHSVSAEVAMPGRRGTGRDGRVREGTNWFDARGLLQFADRPQEAPVLHFGGAWSMTTVGRQTLTTGAGDDLFVDFGTPGLGPGTFTYVTYDGLVPDDAFPVADIEFPAKVPGGGPVQARYTLRERC